MFKRTQQLWRLFTIQYTLARYGLGQYLLDSHLVSIFSPLRLLIYINIGYWFSHNKYSRGEALRRSFEDLGPIFIKFGQTLSTRPDLIPEDITDQLSLLQDRVAPFSSKKAIEIIEQTYQKPLHELFKEFDALPLASASIAQVHQATLWNDKKVIVKVLRPNIRTAIERDISLMYAIAEILERYSKEARRLHIREIVHEFERTILDELDLMREAANASQLRRNFSQSNILYVPEIEWPLAREKVMVMEQINGVPILDLDTLRAHNVNLKQLAERGVEIFFTQVFRDCFFHADMHPGNIFVNINDPQNPGYIAVDFGIMGSLNQHDQHYLAQNFIAFFNRDYRRVAELHIESGWVPYETRVDEFEAAIRTVCEPIFERPLKDISYGQVLLRLFQTGRRFNMEVQPQLMLLQKTLIAIEGLGRQLYPDLDLWHTAKPFLEKWLRDRVSFKAFMNRVKSNAPSWSEQLPQLPSLIFELLSYQRQQQLKDKNQPQTKIIKIKKQSHSKIYLFVKWIIIFAAGFGLAWWLQLKHLI